MLNFEPICEFLLSPTFLGESFGKVSQQTVKEAPKFCT